MPRVNTKVSDIDLSIGKKIRDRRKVIGLNQFDLAHLLGMSYQSLQKYETGKTRFSIGVLMQMSDILNVGHEYFLDHLPSRDAANSGNENVLSASMYELVDKISALSEIEQDQLARIFNTLLPEVLSAHRA